LACARRCAKSQTKINKIYEEIKRLKLLDESELREAASAVTFYDFSDCDADVVAAVDKLKELIEQNDIQGDGTDAAHPAYWRGHDDSCQQCCALINEILDGVPMSGMCSEPWESTRWRIFNLMTLAYKLKGRLQAISMVIKEMGPDLNNTNATKCIERIQHYLEGVGA
jgi:hypothetical protein